MTIAERLARIHTDIKAHALQPDRVTLVAVTKHASIDQMLDAFESGLRDFGENKQQDADDHRTQLAQRIPSEAFQTIRWHFIGHLQSNKVNKTVGRYDLIHSVDSIRLAEKIAHAAQAQGLTQKILLQVNVSGEASKSGFEPSAMDEAVAAIKAMPGVALEGLMAMAPADAGDIGAESVFSRLADLRAGLSTRHGIMLPELSMGMTKDYVPALKNGATIIRLGTLLFGDQTSLKP